MRLLLLQVRGEKRSLEKLIFGPGLPCYPGGGTRGVLFGFRCVSVWFVGAVPRHLLVCGRGVLSRGRKLSVVSYYLVFFLLFFSSLGSEALK